MKLILGFLAAVSIATVAALAVPVHQNDLNATDTPADVLIVGKEGGDAQFVPDVFSLVHALSVHSHGVVSLGTDGVLRSLSPNGTVLDYVKLQNDHIQKLIDRIGRDDELTEMYEGVDGHNVTDIEQILHPNKTHIGKRQGHDEKEIASGIDDTSNPDFSPRMKKRAGGPIVPIHPGHPVFTEKECSHMACHDNHICEHYDSKCGYCVQWVQGRSYCT